MSPLFRQPFYLLLLLILVLAAATFVEYIAGTPAAHTYIYKEWWFFLLWAVTLIASIALFVKIWRRMNSDRALWAVHGGLIVILLGAATSFLTSESGSISIRRGVVERAYLLTMETAF